MERAALADVRSEWSEAQARCDGCRLEEHQRSIADKEVELTDNEKLASILCPPSCAAPASGLHRIHLGATAPYRHPPKSTSESRAESLMLFRSNDPQGSHPAGSMHGAIIPSGAWLADLRCKLRCKVCGKSDSEIGVRMMARD